MKLLLNYKMNNIKYSGLKISTVFLLSFLISLRLSTFGSTLAYYRDSEVSNTNKFVTPSLSFDVKIDGSETAQVDLTSGTTILTPIMTPDVDSVPIQYWVSAQVVGGDINLCNNIDMVGTFPFPYNNRLNLLQTATTTTTGAWSIEFSIFGDRTQYANTSCTFDLIYRGKMDGLVSGYTDTQTVTIVFNVGEQVLPKILNVTQNQVIEESEEVTETNLLMTDDLPQEENIVSPLTSVETLSEEVVQGSDSTE